MFNSLNFEVQFKEPHKGHSGHFKDTHVFKKGMTIIHGPNEAGKSMRSEMLRFALWGRKALRTKVSGYTKLKVTVTFTLKGVDYTLVRSKTTAKLIQAGEDYATGTSPVNDAVEALFGYDLEVFDLANAILQGEVESLGKMNPAQRKALVDSLIGLGAIDDQISALSEERKLDKHSLTTLKDTLVVPQEPVVVAELTQEDLITFPSLKASVLRARAIKGELKGLKTSIPVAPEVLSNTTMALAQKAPLLEQLVTAARTAADYYNSLPDVKTTGYEVEELTRMYTQALNHEACEEVTCPECNHEFNPSGVEPPKYTSSKLSKLRQNEEAHLKKEEALEASVRASYKLKAVENIKGIEMAAQQVKDYRRATQIYQAQLTHHRRTTKRIDELEQEYSKLEKYSGDFEDYERKYNLSLTALQLQVQYQKYKKMYDEQQEKVDNLEARIEDYTKAIAGLRSLKVSIKSYLVPSLNKVASAYLTQMTDGARSSVVISEDFDIKVDGQPMEALSGSAKAVANIAIRLALGQTLTNSVFSVLLADEIDASMDTQRAKYTAQCLRNLKGNIQQIIIISHKRLDADNYVELT